MRRIEKVLFAVVALACLSMLFMSSTRRVARAASESPLGPSAPPHWALQPGKPIVTFLVASVNRPTLNRTLHSLLEQTSPLWKCIVVFDNVTRFGVPLDMLRDPRISMMFLDAKAGQGNNSAGQVRNLAVPHVRTPWVGFVDDDDTVSSNYVKWLLEEATDYPETDVLIFRMARLGQRLIPPYNIPVVPPAEDTTFRSGFVGISFSLKTVIMQRDNFTFIPNSAEDFILLNRLRLAGNYTMVFSKHIGYFVRQDPLPPSFAQTNLSRVVVGPPDCLYAPQYENFDYGSIPYDCQYTTPDSALLCPCPLMLSSALYAGEPFWLMLITWGLLAFSGFVACVLLPGVVIYALCCQKDFPPKQPGSPEASMPIF